MIGWNQDSYRLTNHLGGRVAVQLFRSGVPAGNDAVEILADDRILGRFDECSEKGFRNLRFPPSPALSDVPRNLGGTYDSAQAIANRRNGHRHVNELPVLAPPHCLVMFNPLSA